MPGINHQPLQWEMDALHYYAGVHIYLSLYSIDLNEQTDRQRDGQTDISSPRHMRLKKK